MSRLIPRLLLFLTVFLGIQALPLQAQTNTPTNSLTPTNSFTPNATLTPPCVSPGTFGNKTPNTVLSGAPNQMRASLFSLSAPATVYTVWLDCTGFTPGSQAAVAIYNGSAGNIGSFVVQSSARAVTTGWNSFVLPATPLSSPTYWLAYMYSNTGYSVNYTSPSGPVSNTLFVNSGITFGTFPGSVSPAGYTSNSADGIYAAYCLQPTNTPTVTNTPTSTKTWTPSLTPTNTGTILVNTNTFTMTFTPSFTPSPTMTFSPTWTPNPSLTPSCGAAAALFGETTTCSVPQTAISLDAFRACRYTLNQSGTVQTMSLYLPAQDANEFYITTAIYSNNGSTMVGNLLTQAVTYQPSVAGWNTLQMAPLALTAGDYWLAYMYSGSSPSTFALCDQSIAPPGTTPGGYTACEFGPPPALSGFKFPSNGTFLSPSNYVTIGFYEPIVANFCPGVVLTNTPTPTSTPTSTPTPLPCGATATYFGSTNISGASVTLQSVELLAYQNTLPVDSTIYSISLYATAYDTNDVAEVALYASQGVSMGTLIASSGSTPQTVTAGWNNFSIPASPVTAGSYWLTYLFQAPVSYSIVYQVPTPGGNPSLAYDLNVASSTFPANASTYGSNLAYTNTILGPIIANYCPGLVNTNTPTNTPTITSTFTLTNSPTITSTPTTTGTPTFTNTLTNTGTPTNSLTPTWTGTDTYSFTPTSTFTPTGTPTFTNSWTASFTPTSTPTFTNTVTSTSTNSFTNSPTNSFTLTNTLTGTLTPSPTFTNSMTPTFTYSSTPSYTPTNTGTPSFTPSFTVTNTNSPTVTWTGSFTFTATPTPSFTGTSTGTSTPTNSFTPSPTWTLTSTGTFTFTPTPGASIIKSASETTANVGDIITYSIFLTVIGGNVNNVTVNDVLPAPLSLVAFGSTPPFGVTAWNASTKTVSWSFPFLSPGTYLISYQTQVGSGNKPGTIITNNAQLTYAGLLSPQISSVNVTLTAGGAPPVFYPNPIKGDGPANLDVVFDQVQDYVNIKVFTTAFRKVYEDNVRSVPAGTFLYNLDTNFFKGGRGANGLYYVVVKTPSNRWVIKLLIFR